MAQDDEKDLSNFSMLDIFRMELDTQIASLNEHLLLLEHEKSNAEIFEALMRAAHSIKGAARMVGVNGVVRIAHLLEDCFVNFQSGAETLSQDDIDILFEGVDVIQKILQCSDEEIIAWDTVNSALLEKIEKSLSTIGDHKHPAETKPAENRTRPQSNEKSENLPSRTEQYQAENFTTLRIPVERLDQILSLASKSLVEAHQLSALMPSFWQVRHNQQLIISQLNALQEKLTLNSGSVETRDQLKNIIAAFNSLRYDYTECISQLDAIDRRASVVSDYLHREIMASRMRPIADIVNVLPRVVRDIGRKLNKNVRLKMSGLSTLVDRYVLEKIDIPIKHIIQNAIDHGVEFPHERLANGKEEVATISLQISIRAGILIIVIDDDGSGIDFDALRQRIISRGLATEAEIADHSDAMLIEFLFYPGFSTRTVVSDISGRGVGLDLVKDAVTSLNGSVYAASETGKGTLFKLTLPLTVSVIRSFLVVINGESYAFPASSIDRIYYATKRELRLKSYGFDIEVNGEEIPLISANALFYEHLPRALPEQIAVLVAENLGHKYGIVVEKVEGEQELSIHKLTENVGKIRGISSAAILNSGALTLVIDIEDYIHLIEEYFADNEFVSLNEAENKDICDVLRVLVVDDSLTVRESEKQVLMNLHYQVDTACNGEEALQCLQSKSYDLLITDIDMPVMDGLRLVNEVRFQSQVNSIPILIVSNREKAFVEQGVVLDEKTVFYSKDHFAAKSFAASVQQMVKKSVNV